MLTSTLGSLVGAGAGVAARVVGTAASLVFRLPETLVTAVAQRRALSPYDSTDDVSRPAATPLSPGEGRPARQGADTDHEADGLTPERAHEVAARTLAEAERRDDPAVHEHPTDDLPVPGWNELTVAAIRQRLRTLSRDDITALLAYERDHGERQPVVTALENRLARLVTAEGA